MAAASALVIGALWLDRRIDGWLQLYLRNRGPVLQAMARRGALVRVAMWTVTLVLALAVAARFSPPMAWLLLPAGALALALAVSNMLRDALVGVSQALGRRVQKGEYVAIGDVEGEVLRVGVRTLHVRSLNGTVVDVPQREIAVHGIRSLKAEGGGYPVHVELPIADAVPLADQMEEARLAATLAAHAHMGVRPAVTLSEDSTTRIRVRGLAIDPFAAGSYRAEVALAYRTALEELKTDE